MAGRPMGTGGAAVAWRRRVGAARRRPGVVDLAAFLVGAGIVAALLASALRAAAAAPVSANPISSGAASVALGLVVVGVVLSAIASGTRGGPLALGSTTVFLVLLAPVNRSSVLRTPAMRQVVVAAIAGASVAAVGWAVTANQLARPRARLELWILCGAILGIVAAGAAMSVAGLRMSSRASVGLRGAVVAWWVVDATLGVVTSPMAALARLLVEPPSPVLLGYVSIVAGSLAITGVLRIGGLSVERAWRRSAAADSLRIAVGLNDLRTALLVLRRRAQEGSRSRPWSRIDGRWSRRRPIAARSVRGLLRWPLGRAVRFAALAIVAGAAVGVSGRTPAFAAIACLLVYMAALDASDALAQELDHPDLRRGYPIAEDALSVRHVPIPLVVLTAFCAIATFIAGLVGGATVFLVGLIACPAVALAAMAGATLTASRTARPLASVADFGRPPEIVVPRMALQVLAPVVPLLATVLPVVFALRQSLDVGAVRHALPGVALSFAMLAYVVFRARLLPLLVRALRSTR